MECNDGGMQFVVYIVVLVKEACISFQTVYEIIANTPALEKNHTKRSVWQLCRDLCVLRLMFICISLSKFYA